VTRDLAEAARADADLAGVPAQAMRSVVEAIGADDRATHADHCLRQGHRARHRKFMTR